MTANQPPNCDWFWGSHGCDRPGGHPDTIHTCGTRDPDGPCCQYDTTAPPRRRVRHNQASNNTTTPEWGTWGPYGEGFGMGPHWGAPNITPPHTHHNNTATCHACNPPQNHHNGNTTNPETP
jgi:hypothetical protein